jgi:hypothetical protein
MAQWTVVGGPRGFTDTPEAHDISVGWTYDIAHNDGREKVVRVMVAGSGSLNVEAQSGRRGSGMGALRGYLNDDVVPDEIMLSSSGVTPRRG